MGVASNQGSGKLFWKVMLLLEPSKLLSRNRRLLVELLFYFFQLVNLLLMAFMMPQAPSFDIWLYLYGGTTKTMVLSLYF